MRDLDSPKAVIKESMERFSKSIPYILLAIFIGYSGKFNDLSLYTSIVIGFGIFILFELWLEWATFGLEATDNYPLKYTDTHSTIKTLVYVFINSFIGIVGGIIVYVYVYVKGREN